MYLFRTNNNKLLIFLKSVSIHLNTLRLETERPTFCDAKQGSQIHEFKNFDYRKHKQMAKECTIDASSVVSMNAKQPSQLTWKQG